MSGSDRLAGNGANLVRERAMACRIQAALERMYLLDRTADVSNFVEYADEGDREALLLQQDVAGDVLLSVRLPRLEGNARLDTLCQIIEGVSHFVYVVERVRTKGTATQLELELQAEVDKWVVLASLLGTFDANESAKLRTRLYEHVAFLHDATTELGERYRVANETANRFVRRLERDYLGCSRFGELRAELRRFFRVGQEDKLRFGRAA